MKEKQEDQNKKCNKISKDGACGEWIMTSCIGAVRVNGVSGVCVCACIWVGGGGEVNECKGFLLKCTVNEG